MARLTRRHFVRAAAVGAVAARARPAAAAGANERIAVGVIGCRNRGWQDAGDMITNGRYNVAAFSDADTAMFDEAMTKLKGKLPAKPRFEQDFRRLIEDKSLDAIVVAAPDHWHALMAVMALDAGKHVFLEKPFAHSIADGKAVLDAMSRHPKQVVMVGTQQRSGSHFLECRDFVQGGGLGKVGYVRTWQVHQREVLPKVPDSDPPATMNYDLWVGPAPMRPWNEKRGHYNWHFTRGMGTGDMGNWGAHWIDSARQILGLDLPTSVAGYGHKVIDDIKEWPDTASVLYEFPGLTLSWELRLWSKYGPNGRLGGVEIDVDKGSLVIDRDGWTFFPAGKGEPVKHEKAPMVEPHIENFADCITKGAKPNAPADEGHKSAVCCHLGNITSVLNRRVTFDVKTQSITGDKEAEAMMSREYRKPWHF